MKDDKYVDTLSSELREQACRELNENPDRRNDDIQAIRDWLKKYPYIKADTSAASILNFLRVSKFSLEKAKQRIEYYHTIKEATPEFYRKFDPLLPEAQQVLKVGCCLPLKQKDHLNRQVIILRSAAVDPNLVNMADTFRTNHMVFSVLQKENESMAISGAVLLIDHAGFSAAHLSSMTPSFIKKATKTWQDCSPVRMKAVHHYNVSQVFTTFFNVIMPFLKEKIKNRLFFYESNDLTNLHKSIPKEILPEEYGGSGSTVKELTEFWKKKVEANRDWLLEQENYRLDQSKWQGAKRDLNAELFGIEGSFRKLDID